MSDQPAITRVELEIVRGQAREKRRPVEVPAFLIGASTDCDLVLGARQFPDVYAYLIVDAGAVSVRHLGFAPELLVNGRPVGEGTLRDGDRLRCGPYEFVIHIARHHFTTDADRQPLSRLAAQHSIVADAESPIAPLLAAARLVGDIRAALYGERREIRRPA